MGEVMESVGLDAPASLSEMSVNVDDILNWDVEDVSISEAIKRVGQLFGLSKATGLLRQSTCGGFVRISSRSLDRKTVAAIRWPVWAGLDSSVKRGMFLLATAMQKSKV